jgi:hypothetical protein
VIGTVELAARVWSGDLEIRSGRRWRRQQFPRDQPLTASPTYDQADAGIDALVIATTTVIATARRVMSAVGRDGHVRRHHAALGAGQAHAKPQQNCQGQSLRPMPGPPFHRTPKMTPSAATSKMLLSEGVWHIERSDRRARWPIPAPPEQGSDPAFGSVSPPAGRKADLT